MKNGSVYCEVKGQLRELFAPKIKSDTLVYVNNRVGEPIINKLITEGFEVVNSASGLVSWSDALMACLKM